MAVGAHGAHAQNHAEEGQKQEPAQIQHLVVEELLAVDQAANPATLKFAHAPVAGRSSQGENACLIDIILMLHTLKRTRAVMMLVAGCQWWLNLMPYVTKSYCGLGRTKGVVLKLEINMFIME